MPIYEYRCKKGHTFEVFQSMSEDPVSKCVECGAPSERMLSAPAIHYKGSGFYTTDYARKSGAKASASSGSGDGNSGPSSADGGSSSSESGSSSSDKGGDKKSSASSSAD